ncbi:MAG TPA: hypothetical protein PKO33_04695 [Pyrinomonadaceae bacterium]|nr:hypothetical protein [Pyrinomonadaceae bacterium]
MALSQSHFSVERFPNNTNEGLSGQGRSHRLTGRFSARGIRLKIRETLIIKALPAFDRHLEEVAIDTRFQKILPRGLCAHSGAASTKNGIDHFRSYGADAKNITFGTLREMRESRG